MSGILDQIKLEKWYQALTLIGTACAIGAFASHEKDWAMLGAGLALIGLGNWKDYVTRQSEPFGHLGGVYQIKKTAYTPSVVGVSFVIAGLALVGRAVWRLW